MRRRQRQRRTSHRPRGQERPPRKPAVSRVSSFGGPIDIKAEAAVARRCRPELYPPRETQRTLPICITLAINFAKGKQQNKTKQKHVSSTGGCGVGQSKSRFFCLLVRYAGAAAAEVDVMFSLRFMSSYNKSSATTITTSLL